MATYQSPSIPGAGIEAYAIDTSRHLRATSSSAFCSLMLIFRERGYPGNCTEFIRFIVFGARRWPSKGSRRYHEGMHGDRYLRNLGVNADNAGCISRMFLPRWTLKVYKGGWIYATRSRYVIRQAPSTGENSRGIQAGLVERLMDPKPSPCTNQFLESCDEK